MVDYQPPTVEKYKGKWRALTRYRDERGVERRRTHVLAGASTRDDALDLAGAWYAGLVREEMSKNAQAGDTIADTVSAAPTLYEACLRWIETQEKRDVIEKTTAYSKRGHLKCLAGRPLGAMPPANVRPLDIELWIDDCAEGRIGPTTINKVLDCMRQVYRRLERDGAVASNPVNLIDKPKMPKARDVNYIPRDEYQALMEHLDGYGSRAMPLAVRISLCTGMRVGEVCALRRSQVDFDCRIITVNASMGRVKGSTYVRKATKNDRTRRIPISKELLPVLRDACEGLKRSSCVLTGSERHYSPSKLSKEWTSATLCWGVEGSAGTRPTFHDLRHTFATYWVAAGGDIKALQEIMGHASAAMTLDLYSSGTINSMRAGMEHMTAWLRGSDSATAVSACISEDAAAELDLMCSERGLTRSELIEALILDARAA